MTMRKFNIENIKSITLVFLFILALFQTAYKFGVFGDFLFSKGSPYPYALSLEEGLQDTVQPSQIIVRFGGERSTKILSSKKRFYEEIRPLMGDIFLSAQTLQPSLATELENAKSFKSLQLNYSSLNGKLLSRSFFLEKSALDEITDIREILLPLSGQDFCYIRSGKHLYKIKLAAAASFSFIDDLENSNYLNYQSLHSLFGVKSPVLVPTGSFNLKFENYDTISAVDSAKNAEIASKVFGKKYDFATRITETDGSEIYTYNYGQQVLKIQPSGLIHYTSEESASKDTSVDEAAYIALNFLKQIHFNWDNISLIESKEIEVKGQKGHLFRFCETMKGLPILNSSDTSSIHIIVRGDKIHSYNALLRSTLPYDLSRDSLILGPMEVLNPSFNTVLKNKFDVTDSNQLFDKISEIELIYYMDEQYLLTPCWKMSIDGKNFLFNAYTGEIEPYGLV